MPSFNRIRALLLVATIILITTPRPLFACSSCPCSFNSEWASEGYSTEPGFRFDVRYDYISQRELRQGSRAVSHSDFTFPNDQEVQQHTITRMTSLGFDYIPTRDWGIRTVVPFVDRTHTTIMEGETETTGSATLGLGDITIVGRYQGFTPEADLGIQLGIKLPSGTFTDTFNEGPDSGEDDAHSDHALLPLPTHGGMENEQSDEPERIDRGLQNGTGTTDLILGIYKFGNLAPKTEYFAQILGGQPLEQRSGFRTGTAIGTSVGVSYKATDWVKPQLQLNYRVEGREEGENSDHENSGGQFLRITPGFTFYPTSSLAVYTLVEVPLLQNVNGLQLQPQAIYSVGIRYGF